MLRKSIMKSGLALANAGVATVANAGLRYFLDPKRGEQRRRALRERARTLLTSAEKIADNLTQGFHLETAELSQLVDRMTPGRRASVARPLMATGIGLSIGAGLMYFLDPQDGPGRRARLRDLLTQTAKGIARAVRKQLHPTRVSDAELVERVQTVTQYVIAHPETVSISVDEGVVTVAGSVLQDEVETLLACIAAVRGVRGVSNHLGQSGPANGDGAPLYPAHTVH